MKNLSVVFLIGLSLGACASLDSPEGQRWNSAFAAGLNQAQHNWYPNGPVEQAAQPQQQNCQIVPVYLADGTLHHYETRCR